jgi:hypothetical protein
MTAWDVGSVALHGNEITVGWRMDDDEQERRARALYDEYRAEPDRLRILAAALNPTHRIKSIG